MNVSRSPRVLSKRIASAVLLWAIATTSATAQPAQTLIGGHTYAFPAAIFLGGQAETGPRGDILIELAWPEMRGLTPAEASAWPRRNTIRILANSAAQVAGRAVPEAELTDKIPTYVSISTDLSSGIAWRASGHLAPLQPAHDAADPGEPDPGRGIERVAVAGLSALSAPHDVFVADPIEHPVEFIDCSRHTEMITNPECAQTFVASNLILKVSYRRALVPQWREIHAAVVTFLVNHEVHR